MKVLIMMSWPDCIGEHDPKDFNVIIALPVNLNAMSADAAYDGSDANIGGVGLPLPVLS